MKVGMFLNTDGACDFYRARLPIETADTKGALDSKTIWTSNLLYEVANRTQKFWDVMSSDIYLIQRLSGLSLISKIKEFISETKMNSKIVIDHDDDIFNVSPMSNHYSDYGTSEIKIMHGGKIIHEWKDGDNIDIKLNQHRIDEVKRTLEKADLVTVTTDILAEVFRPYNDRIRVLPNCVDISHWNKIELIRRNPEEIRICWAGGHSHWEDLYMIRDPLIEIGKKYPNVKILMLGYMPLSMEKSFRQGQLEFHRWVDTKEHPYRLAALDIDIAIIPLKNTVFNKSKSAIKWIEFSSLQIPSVTSYISPYKEVAEAEHGENGIFIADNDKQGWVDGIEMLINSKSLRQEIGKKARQTVEAKFDINKQYRQWVLAYEEVLGANTIQPVIV